MNPKDKDFLALQDKWYKKLKSSGFNDVEQDESRLRQSSNTELHKRGLYDDPLRREARQEYYRLAGQFLHDYEFEDNKEKVIWEMHSDGTSIQDIVVAMKSRNFKVYKRYVHETIQRLAKEMGDRCRNRS